MLFVGLYSRNYSVLHSPEIKSSRVNVAAI
jgi:hypothetical protein